MELRETVHLLSIQTILTIQLFPKSPFCQIATLLFFSRDSFLFLLLPPPLFFLLFLIDLFSSAFGPLVSKCEQMENKSNGGLVWSGQRHAACYFFARTTTAVWWSGPSSVLGDSSQNKGGVKTPLISILFDCYFGRPFHRSVLPAIMWDLTGFFSKISSHRTLLHNQLVGFMVSGYTWHTGLPVRGSSFL